MTCRPLDEGGGNSVNAVGDPVDWSPKRRSPRLMTQLSRTNVAIAREHVSTRKKCLLRGDQVALGMAQTSGISARIRITPGRGATSVLLNSSTAGKAICTRTQGGLPRLPRQQKVATQLPCLGAEPASLPHGGGAGVPVLRRTRRGTSERNVGGHRCRRPLGCHRYRRRLANFHSTTRGNDAGRRATPVNQPVQGIFQP